MSCSFLVFEYGNINMVKQNKTLFSVKLLGVWCGLVMSVFSSITLPPGFQCGTDQMTSLEELMWTKLFKSLLTKKEWKKEKNSVRAILLLALEL